MYICSGPTMPSGSTLGAIENPATSANSCGAQHGRGRRQAESDRKGRRGLLAGKAWTVYGHHGPGLAGTCDPALGTLGQNEFRGNASPLDSRWPQHAAGQAI